MSLSYFVQELFRDDLTNEGRGLKVPESFLEEMERWKIPATSAQGDKTHEVKAVSPKAAASSEDLDITLPARPKINPREPLKPSRKPRR